MVKIKITEQQFYYLKENLIIEDDSDFLKTENKKSVYGIWKKAKQTPYKAFGQMSWQNKKSWSR